MAAAGTTGTRRWAIGDGYIPESSTGDAPDLVSHEALCMLNAGDKPAHGTLRVFYVDRDPGGPYRFEIPARRTCHLRLNDLRDPEPIPAATPYSMLIECDVPIVVQHTRLDSRQSALALFSTVAHALD